MKSELKYFSYGILVSIVLSWLLFTRGCSSKHTNEVVVTDTVYVNKPYKEIVLKEIEIPKTIYVHKTDTIFREKLIKDTLIAGIEINKKKALIHTITPKGIPLIREFEIPPFKKLEINHQGDLDYKPKNIRRQKFWKNVGRIGLFIGGVWLGNKLKNKR